MSRAGRSCPQGKAKGWGLLSNMEKRGEGGHVKRCKMDKWGILINYISCYLAKKALDYFKLIQYQKLFEKSNMQKYE